MRAAVALARSAHPAPTLAVTALSTAVAAAAGRGAGGCLLVAATVLAGQLSIGWSNDLVDVERDRAAGRRDKPLARDEVGPGAVRTACALALLACAPLSLAHGWRAGTAHLVVVAGGWAYNLGAKRTALSWLPYAISFGALPAFLALGLPGHPAPRPWVVLAGALLGLGAHFLNVVPDITADLAVGVRGLPQRLGERRSRAVGALLLAASVVVVTVGAGDPPPWAYAGCAVAVGLAVLAAALGRRAGSRLPFLLALGTAALAVALLVGRGGAIA
jgi:4-hydroxybenzoate polyprenyltransferase